MTIVINRDSRISKEYSEYVLDIFLRVLFGGEFTKKELKFVQKWLKDSIDED